ncbi:hypothetical protein [uncultured Clostridium sp.]|jgi:hypothetical protein|uniref:hypothetical protein n=1 Tax=uncultured Clostridium sp. TaxID=59620 RepID=UPI00280AD618|nr:hypothetical protein [uncultured Clostridium sp.]
MKIGLKCLIATVLLTSSFTIFPKADVNNKTVVDNSSIVIEKEASVGDVTLPNNELLQEIKEEQKGSILIQLEDTQKALDKENVKFSISKVADVIDGEYKLLDNLTSVNIDLNTLKNSNELEVAANKLSKVVEHENIATTDNSGKGKIEDLEVGVYLVKAIDIANYENITPFLISIPTCNEVDKTMDYDVNAIPKHTPLPEPNKPKVPDTNYNNKSYMYLALGTSLLLISLGTLAIGKKKENKKVV